MAGMNWAIMPCSTEARAKRASINPLLGQGHLQGRWNLVPGQDFEVPGDYKRQTR